MHLIKRWSLDLSGLLFPDLCNACGTPLFVGENLICIKCLFDLPFTDYHLHAENRVAKQLWGRLPIHAAMAMMYFRKGAKVQNLIHNLKYHDRILVGKLLGKMLGERLNASHLYIGIDFIIPVPLHYTKFRKRGYNQSTSIAEGISQEMGVPFSETKLIRLLETESQTKKSRYNRYENMKAVFKVTEAESIIGKHILLIDDVITTGATLEACANELLTNGAAKVSIAALAFAE
ncbi:ComF family protein [Pedobacter mucosus]|uniref:ComF family protein n=1 Tax=Pedobacter mucosus TaxID=2895286 RepID=UPI001EE42101|nr:ComF family protein [Pedobacter mucosus]UKT63236.1 ComF family protein [Pedobacter mucosus]